MEIIVDYSRTLLFSALIDNTCGNYDHSSSTTGHEYYNIIMV